MEPLRAEIPVRFGMEEQPYYDSLSLDPITRADYERLGISSRILDYNPTIALKRTKPSQFVIIVNTPDAIETGKDPFVDIILGLKWTNGGVAKTYSLMVGDVSQVTVRPGQSLSEIASQISPQLGGADMDEAMLALYKANPDAFIGGSIHRLKAGAELSKPSASLMDSITPAQAKEFAIEANRVWLEQYGQPTNPQARLIPTAPKTVGNGEDRLRIGPGTGSEADTRRYVEEMVAQEKALAQSKARVAELEKNIADLQKLLEARKQELTDTKSTEAKSSFDQWAPAFVGIGLVSITGVLLWSLARYTRRAEANAIEPLHKTEEHSSVPDGSTIPPKAAAILSSLDLNLGPSGQQEIAAGDALRVKLNLVKAYITIEDFVAARKALEEILFVSNQVDPQITIAARSLMAEINQRSDV
jgi:pilus assembly protein FimV